MYHHFSVFRVPIIYIHLEKYAVEAEWREHFWRVNSKSSPVLDVSFSEIMRMPWKFWLCAWRKKSEKADLPLGDLAPLLHYSSDWHWLSLPKNLPKWKCLMEIEAQLENSWKRTPKLNWPIFIHILLENSFLLA